MLAAKIGNCPFDDDGAIVDVVAVVSGLNCCCDSDVVVDCNVCKN